MNYNGTGSIIANGVDGIALIAQSSGSNGGGDITVNIKNASSTQLSTIMGGTGQGTGISILGGANNQLNNEGIITTALSVDGYAIRGATGNDHIDNRGQIIGSIDLGSGMNSVTNITNRHFDSGSVVNLGAGGMLTNEGIRLRERISGC